MTKGMARDRLGTAIGITERMLEIRDTLRRIVSQEIYEQECRAIGELLLRGAMQLDITVLAFAQVMLKQMQEDHRDGTEQMWVIAAAVEEMERSPIRG